MPAIQVKNLSKHFQIPIKKPGVLGALAGLFRRNEFRTVKAVDGISFNVQKGELVGFLGPNGAGKTTTMKMLSGLLYPSSGSIDILGYSPSERRTEFQKIFSMVMGQRTQLWWDLPARETFALNQKIFEIPEDVFQTRKNELVELLELEELVDVPVKKLSLGERMKAELACALLHQPQVLLLDEPTLGLDLVMQKKLRQFILDYNQRTQSTILLTSHNMSDVEELCKRVIVIHDGTILYDGDLAQIVQKYAPDKLISLTTAAPMDIQAMQKYGTVVESGTHTVKLEIPRNAVSKNIAALLAHTEVIDLSVEELSIEDIVRKVFSKTTPPQ